MEFLVENLWMLWTLVAMVCFVMEMVSGDFYITCFGIGALVSVAVSFLPLPFWVQIVVFACASIASIFLLRPILLEVINRNRDHRESNMDAVIGRLGYVSETILAGRHGRVSIDGDDWKAVSDDVADIEAGQRVKVVAHESIILKVERA